ncbi:hypothetical protein CLF_109594 [Clonorchis sinensis]|uniref:Uncharacterized protein n=1 Tax=Clonorchis sinensis TaxID=79923 RepID=G7YSS1_CLOSI|nr:hypothetical protein CLF_109594 [Clonorchis sinensis]
MAWRKILVPCRIVRKFVFPEERTLIKWLSSFFCEKRMRSECIQWKLVCEVCTTMRSGRRQRIRRFQSYDDNLKVKWKTVTQNTTPHHERWLSDICVPSDSCHKVVESEGCPATAIWSVE